MPHLIKSICKDKNFTRKKSIQTTVPTTQEEKYQSFPVSMTSLISLKIIVQEKLGESRPIWSTKHNYPLINLFDTQNSGLKQIRLKIHSISINDIFIIIMIQNQSMKPLEIMGAGIILGIVSTKRKNYFIKCNCIRICMKTSTSKLLDRRRSQ